MMPTPGPRRSRNSTHMPLILAITGLGVIVIGVVAWLLITELTHKPATTVVKSTPVAPQPTQATPVGGTVSPYVFGTNLSLFDGNDQVLNSATTRSLLQQMHVRIIRMPARPQMAQETLMAAANAIKSVGAVPLVILEGKTRHATALEDDKLVIDTMNTVFGNNPVYYEYSNEDDLSGIGADQYINAWNSVVPALKTAATNGKFIGPVNFHYDHAYLMAFLQQAQPRPDAISWHEYTCDRNQAADVCLSHIDRWTQHISDARQTMKTTVGSDLPIMITEWNYAPNAQATDPKTLDQQFMTSWTAKAFQTLSANRVFASMQYSCTNAGIPLVRHDDTITIQGTAFQNEYQKIIINGQQPAALTGTNPGGAAGNSPSAVTVNGPVAYSFEDGGADGWQLHGNGIANVQNSGSIAAQGSHSLQLTLANKNAQNFPYIAVSAGAGPAFPHQGQTVHAYLYVNSNAVTVNAKLILVDGQNHWDVQNAVPLAPGTWTKLSFTVPPNFNGNVQQIGIQFNAPAGSGVGADVNIDAVGWN
jgi:hypothetical protein